MRVFIIAGGKTMNTVYSMIKIILIAIIDFNLNNCMNFFNCFKKSTILQNKYKHFNTSVFVKIIRRFSSILNDINTHQVT